MSLHNLLWKKKCHVVTYLKLEELNLFPHWIALLNRWLISIEICFCDIGMNDCINKRGEKCFSFLTTWIEWNLNNQHYFVKGMWKALEWERKVENSQNRSVKLGHFVWRISILVFPTNLTRCYTQTLYVSQLPDSIFFIFV